VKLVLTIDVGNLPPANASDVQDLLKLASEFAWTEWNRIRPSKLHFLQDAPEMSWNIKK
jgi:hypothetical protein